MGAITDLWKSERGLLTILIIIAATVLTALGNMTIEMWKEMTLYIFGIYVAGKTVTGAVGLFKGTLSPDAATPAPAPAEPAAPAPAPATPAAEPPK
jgi:hypothetical protein